MVSFLSFFLHLSCFTPSLHHHRRRRRRRHSYSAALKASFFSFFKRLFSSSSSSSASNLTPQPPPPTSLRSPSSSTRSFRLNSTLFPDPHPCSVCGEVFRSPPLLEHHRSIHHPISELDADDENIVRIIFKTGWPAAKTPKIHRILKIHNTSKTISRFEEHRERVKSRAAAARQNPAPRDERCAADGNELLRFHCATFVCDLDAAVCGRPYCSLCGIIASGFSPKMDGISTLPTSYGAHAAVPEEMEAEFEFMNVKRAVLVCRVVAGRVGCDPCEADKDDPGFDSLAGRGADDEDEISVFNPRAVLPCFVILYTVL